MPETPTIPTPAQSPRSPGDSALNQLAWKAEDVLDNLGRRVGIQPGPRPERDAARGNQAVDFHLGDATNPGTVLHARADTPIRVTVDGQQIEIADLVIPRQPATDALGVAGARLVEVRKERDGTPKYSPRAHDPGGSIRLDPTKKYAVEIPVGTNRSQYISLESFTTLPRPEATPAPTPAPPTPREQLESRIESQNLVIAGVKSKERRVYDLVNKSMERAKGWGKQAFKEVFEHKLTKYYGELLDIAKSPFAEEAIRLAEQKGEAEYNNYLQSINLPRRAARKVIEGFKAFALKTTWVQDATIRHLRDTQQADIQAALTRGRKMYLEEKGDFAGRFDTAFDREDLAVRKDMGENFSQVAAQPYAQEIKTLIKQFVHGDIDDDTFAAHKDALWARIKTANPDLLKDAEDYADTLTAVGKQYQEQWTRQANNAEGRNRIDGEIESMRVALGIGQMGEATSMNKTDTQKWTGKIKEWADIAVRKNIIGASLFNEATVGTAVAYALSAKSFGSMFITSGARAMGGFVAGGAAAGVFGAAREKGRLTAEYWSYLGEKEAGVQTVAGSKKREWFDKLDVTRRKSTDVVSALREKLYNADGSVKANLTDKELRSTLGQLADAKARWALSSRKEKRVGLIEIGALGGQERNRTEFVRTLDQTEQDLSRYVAGHADVKARLMDGQEYDAFLSGLTATQTQILDKGKATFYALQDPAQKLALTHVAGYSPEVEKLRHRIAWLWGEKHSVGTASGLEAALKEFNKQANAEAVKRGIYTGAIGMGIGALTQELAMDAAYYKQFGWQGLDSFGHGAVADAFGVEHSLPLSDMSDAIPGIAGSADNVITHSKNMIFDGKFYDLVDRNGQVIHDNVIDTTQLHFDHGKLTDDAAKYVGEQMHKFGFEAELQADTLSAPLSGETHDLLFGPNKVKVPEELHWVENGDGSSRLVLEVQNSAGAPEQHVIVAHEVLVEGRPEHAEEVLKAIHNDPWLDVIPGKETLTNIPPVRMDLTDLPSYQLADGTNHVLQATLPSGTNLVETSHGVYNLVDSHNPHNILLQRIHIDDKGFISNLDTLNKSQEALANHLHLHNTDYSVPLEGESGGAFDIRAGFLDDKTPYMGNNTVWEWGERTLGKGGPQDNLFKNSFRAWHHWDGSDNADIAQSEVPGVHRIIPRVTGGFKMSDGNVGYENSLDFNRLSDNTYIRDIPDSLFSDTNITRYATLMEDTLKEANTWQAANPGADVNAVLAHLQATNELQYLAYKHGYIGQYFTEGDWDHFRELFEAPTSLDLHSPHIAQDLVSHGPPAINVIDTEVVNNIISLRAPEDQLPIPIIPILRRRGLEPAPTHPISITPSPEIPPSYYGYYWGIEARRPIYQAIRPMRRLSLQQNLPTNWEELSRLLNLNQTTQPSTYSYSYSNQQFQQNEVALGTESITELRRLISGADELIFAVGPRIGDGIMGLAYVQAIQQKINALGLRKQVTVITTKQLQTLFQPSQTGNLNVLASEEIGGYSQRGDNVRRSVEYASGKNNSVVFDFESEGEPEMAHIQAVDKNLTVVSHLLPNAIMGYNNDAYGDHRFHQYANDLLGTSDTAGETQLELHLPPDANSIYARLLHKYNINDKAPQVAILIESHEPGKRYALDKWLEAARTIQAQKRNAQFNIVINPTTSDTMKQQILSQLRAMKITNAQLIEEGSLLDLLVLLKHQKVVLANDTGVGIATSMLQDGPKVVSLFLPGFSRDWRASSVKQTVIEALFDPSNPEGGIPCTDESKKWINRIAPSEIAQEALKELNTSSRRPTPEAPEPPKPVLLPGAKKILRKLSKLPNFDSAYKTKFEGLANQLQSTASRPQQKAVLDQLRDLTVAMEEDFKLKRGTPNQRQIENAGKLNVPVMQEWKRLDDRPLFIRLNDEKGTFDNLEVHPEQVPSQLGILVQQFASQFGLDPDDVKVNTNFEKGQWKISGSIPSKRQEFGCNLKPDKKNGFTVADVTSAGFGAKETLIPLALTPDAILTNLNGKLTNVIVSNLSIRPDGTLLFTGKHK